MKSPLGLLSLLSAFTIVLVSCSSEEETAATDAGLDCAPLSETACEATEGCQVVMGHVATEPPGTAIHYAGCATGKGFPGSMFACGSAGPDGPCWVFPNYHAPTGWPMWNCTGDEQTVEACMAQSPW